MNPPNTTIVLLTTGEHDDYGPSGLYCVPTDELSQRTAEQSKQIEDIYQNNKNKTFRECWILVNKLHQDMQKWIESQTPLNFNEIWGGPEKPHHDKNLKKDNS